METKTNFNPKNLQKVIEGIYKEKGLQGLRSYLRKNNINFEEEVYEFGFDSKKNNEAKQSFLGKPFSFHYYSKLCKAKNGYHVNLLRGIRFSNFQFA